MLRHPRALLIDLDDTILDATESSDRVWRDTSVAFADRLGHDADAIDAALLEARAWYWDDPSRHREGRLDLHRARTAVVADALERLGSPDHAAAAAFARAYTEQRVDAMRPFGGAIQTIQRLRGLGMRLALITNGQAETQRAKVTAHALETLFDTVLIEGELGYGKPQPRLYERALDELQTPAHAAWCVGDNLEWEVCVPQQIGMTGVWIDWAQRGLPDDAPCTPDLTLHRLADLPDHLPG